MILCQNSFIIHHFVIRKKVTFIHQNGHLNPGTLANPGIDRLQGHLQLQKGLPLIQPLHLPLSLFGAKFHDNEMIIQHFARYDLIDSIYDGFEAAYFS